MKKSIFLLFCVIVITSISCSKDETLSEKQIVAKDNSKNYNILKFDNINNSKLKEQLPKSIEHLKKILNEKYKYIYKEHLLSDLSIDKDAVFYIIEDNIESFNFNLTIPHSSKEEKLNLYCHLTFKYQDSENISNNLIFGYYYDKSLDFDVNGKINENKYYSPKPSNIPSKAPKSVICNYFNTNGWPSNLSPWNAGCAAQIPIAPLTQQQLNWILYNNSISLNHNTNHLYILSFNHPSGRIPYSTYQNNQWTIKSEITTFYHKVKVPQVSNFVVYAQNLSRADHIHKQAFIDSYFLWMQKLSYGSAMILMYNNKVSKDIFNIFADYNLYENMEDGVYIGVQWGEYAPNLNLRRLTKASNYLTTPAGFTLINQYASGAITNQQFRNILNNL